MKIKAIGASGGTAPGYRTTCYFIDDQFLIDCGAAASGLNLEQQAQIENIFITHPHLDHIKDIPFIVENTFSSQRKQLHLRSSKDILNDVHENIFNNVIWPDFSKIISNAKTGMSPLQFSSFEDTYEFEGYSVQMIEVNHPGNAVGYLIDDGLSQVIFTGDTGPTDKIWKIANQQPNLKAVFTEISFPNAMAPLAEVSGHFTLESLLDDLKKLKKEVPVYINHFKPQYFSELVKEFHENAPDNLCLLHQDHEIETD
jgi:ribonuclease BN (tRNA processing enzyme)